MPNELKYTILGMMSGTSLDGLDLSLCEFKFRNNQWRFRFLNSTTINYNQKEKTWLKNLENCTGETLWKGHIEYGKYLGRQANVFLETCNEKPDIIASHGHTIFHKPEIGYTFQAGHGQEIAQITGIKTISDFRQKDVSFSGQGAPLVPIGDLHLFDDFNSCLNLGGFANISIKNENEITAFDICPVNYVLNNLAQKEGLEFDESGNLARSGKIDSHLLEKLNKIPFYSLSPPKSLGREWVEEWIFPILDSFDLSSKDKMRTFCEHTAIQIALSLPSKGKTLVTGGGVYNSFFMELISKKAMCSVEAGSPQLIDFKEAMIFAFLAALNLSGQNNCLAQVTGAKKDCIGGTLFNP